MDERNMLMMMVLDDYDEEFFLDWELEERKGRIEVNIQSWRTLGDPTFKQHFRMNCATFEVNLILAVGSHLKENNMWLRRSRKGLDVALMMVLWILATPDTFRSVAVKFNTSQGVVHFHYKYIILALRQMAAKYIRWSDQHEMELISGIFEERYGYPGVIGCIDGCNINDVT
ncbi:Protein ANTAGONIST OF LIKE HETEROCHROMATIN PROTEIN 1 [Frankliniella fusca]|uniref:Protein ANTAGONIST OF LIKE HETEROCHROMATIN PROTEIN 1 n=1 Tax=Frankliniella fusca TaxID=407009 RepID=A0AAE1HDJ4_9NEOP|nr:Protein ANTAGONIST OF LIKE HETEROCHROMATIN PROTEIN 1 [Frankliniella fusca]